MPSKRQARQGQESIDLRNEHLLRPLTAFGRSLQSPFSITLVRTLVAVLALCRLVALLLGLDPLCLFSFFSVHPAVVPLGPDTL